MVVKLLLNFVIGDGDTEEVEIFGGSFLDVGMKSVVFVNNPPEVIDFFVSRLGFIPTLPHTYSDADVFVDRSLTYEHRLGDASCPNSWRP